MRAWKIIAVAGLTSFLGVACERVGGEAKHNQPRKNDSELPMGETTGRQFGESGTGGSGHTGALNVNPTNDQPKDTGNRAQQGHDVDTPADQPLPGDQSQQVQTQHQQ